jgi:hypothetical protein
MYIYIYIYNQLTFSIHSINNIYILIYIINICYIYIYIYMIYCLICPYISIYFHINWPFKTPRQPSGHPSAASLELDPPLAKSSSADQVFSAVPALSRYWRMGRILVFGCLISVWGVLMIGFWMGDYWFLGILVSGDCFWMVWFWRDVTSWCNFQIADSISSSKQQMNTYELINDLGIELM